MTETIPAEWAARYAAATLPVLPLHSIRDGRCTCGRADCQTPGKHPLTRNGKDDATTDLARITEWARRWPWANWGIRPPPGLVVLDVDPRNGGGSALVALIGPRRSLPRTLTARTGGGGLHIWLGYSGPARGKLADGIDVKTSSGYVVAPPARHASGRRYEWLTGLPTAPAPAWVRRMLAPPAPVTLHRPGTSDGAGAAGLVRVVASAAHGNRNKLLYWAARRVHERGSDPAALAEIHAAACTAGLAERDVDRTLASAARGASR